MGAWRHVGGFILVDFKPLIVGNWKMNGMQGDLGEVNRLVRLLRAFRVKFRGAGLPADVMLCPPLSLLSGMVLRRSALRAKGLLMLGGQDCHMSEKGAFTGDISAGMLRDAGAEAVIVGHSERRLLRGERDSMIAKKCLQAQAHGLFTILCVGETRAERIEGQAKTRVQAQLRAVPSDVLRRRDVATHLAVAYEPVWAIGTGHTPTLAEIDDMHATIRKHLVRRTASGAEGSKIRILYGGSVTHTNAAEILARNNVDGALVGGASLKASDFARIVLAKTNRIG